MSSRSSKRGYNDDDREYDRRRQRSRSPYRERSRRRHRRGREDDYGRDRHRSRSRHRHRRHRDDESPPRSHRSRQRHRDKYDDRSDSDSVEERRVKTSVKETKEEHVTAVAGDTAVVTEKKEPDDYTKDQRTVFVSQLVMKANEKQLRTFFGKVGKVKDVIMIRDKYTNRHKGFAYVEMAELDAVPMVLMLNGTLPDFQKFPILVKASEAEKNFVAKSSSDTQYSGYYQGNNSQQETASVSRRRLLIGNLHPKISEDDIRTVLTPFGEIDDVELVPGGAQAYVSFLRPEDAQKASTSIIGIELGAGTPITVAFAQPSAIDAPGGNSVGEWRLDAGDDGGMTMDASSRMALMQQLGKRAGIAETAAAALGRHSNQTQLPPLPSTPRAALCVSNMFDPSTETEANWEEDIREDVLAESEKFGKVLHVHVDAISTRGLVHILFDSEFSAEKAAHSLHGRYFAGRLIAVTYVDPQTHRMQFADEIK